MGPAPTLSRQFATTHTFHCQKLFRINDHVGLIIVGDPSLGEMKAQHAIFAFINWLKEHKHYEDYAKQMVVNWQTFCGERNVLEKHGGQTELVFAGIKDKTSPSPFSQKMGIKKGQIALGVICTYGVVATGVHEILDKMFGGRGILEYPVKEFPLQDAVEFVEFLIQTQIGIDKYTARIPRVGGDIDIAVIHPNHGFAWAKQKGLQRIMEAQTNN